MKWTLFVSLALIGLVAGNGAWKESQVYTYHLVVKTFLKMPQSNKETGSITSIGLTIRPQSDTLLIGQLTQVIAIVLDEQDSTAKSDENSPIQELSKMKPFKIHLKNGVISSLSVDRQMTSVEIDRLKFVVSQFQLDTKAQNVMASEFNHLPDTNSDNAFYMTMEPTVTGECETTYDISRLPEYLVYANRESIPLPKLAGEGDVIEIVKNTNYRNCNKRNHFLSDFAGQKDYTNQMDSNSTESYSRIFITGSLDDYTIQSSVATNKVAGVSMYVYLTLESVEQSKADSQYKPRFANLENIGNLVYTNDARKNEYRQDDTENRTISHTTHTSTLPQYPGCEATFCYSALVPQNELCAKTFGDRLPVHAGTLFNCAPGFWRGNCCPRLSE